MSTSYDRWLQPQDWQRDGDADPVLGLGAEGAFDDMHLFAPCALFEEGQYRLYYPGSQGDVVGRVFRLGHASSTDGIHFRKHPEWPIFEVGDDAHSVLTPALLESHVAISLIARPEEDLAGHPDEWHRGTGVESGTWTRAHS